MIEVVKKGKSTKIAFVCPICTCEFVADAEGYNREERLISVSKEKRVYDVAYQCHCPNCKFEAETRTIIEEVKRE